MLAVLGMVFMVVGGLLLLSATRSYALYRTSRRQRATIADGSAWLKLLVGMIVTGVVLIVVGYLLAF